MMNLTESKKQALELSANLITWNFDWGSSPQGQDYWIEVTKNLRKLAGTLKEPPEPEWITPTDEDAKRRPEVEVRDVDEQEWKTAKLVYVSTCEEHPFFTLHGSAALGWKQCRMRKDSQ